MLCLTRNQTHKTGAQPDRRQHQFVPGKRFGISGKHIKHRGRILPDRLIAGKDSAVRVELCRGIIVIAGSKMHIAPDAIFLAAHDKRNLAVRLKADQTVDDMAARLL